MTKIQNPKQLAVDLIWDLDILIWNLFEICSLLFGILICNLLYPVYPDQVWETMATGSQRIPQGAAAAERGVIRKSAAGRWALPGVQGDCRRQRRPGRSHVFKKKGGLTPGSNNPEIRVFMYKKR